jgi:predicted DNA-binding transcriptional regulator AlpA
MTSIDPSPTKPAHKEYLTRKEAAELIGVKASLLAAYEMRDRGPPIVKLTQRTIRYPRAELLAWMSDRVQLSPNQCNARI